MRTTESNTIISGNTGKKVTLLKPHDQLSNAVVISYTHLDDGSEHWRPNGVALCYTGGYTPYVTWNAYNADDGDGKWYAEAGHYFTNITDAAEDYKKRGGK